MKLTKDNVIDLHNDVNSLIKKNRKAYSVIRTTGQATEDTILNLHRPKDGFFVVPHEVAKKMSNTQRGSKFFGNKFKRF